MAVPQINDPRPQYFKDADLDRIMAVVLNLANELWVAKDRIFVLEQLLAQRGAATTAEVDAYQPSGEAKARLEADRKEYIARVLSGLALQPKPIEEIRAAKAAAGHV
jgi:hypothetical protein